MGRRWRVELTVGMNDEIVIWGDDFNGRLFFEAFAANLRALGYLPGLKGGSLDRTYRWQCFGHPSAPGARLAIEPA